METLHSQFCHIMDHQQYTCNALDFRGRSRDERSRVEHHVHWVVLLYDYELFKVKVNTCWAKSFSCKALHFYAEMWFHREQLFHRKSKWTINFKKNLFCPCNANCLMRYGPYTKRIQCRMCALYHLVRNINKRRRTSLDSLEATMLNTAIRPGPVYQFRSLACTVLILPTQNGLIV